MTKAVVIGGGLAGLATTALLLREGYEVHLVEQNEHLGGRAGTFELDGFRWDTGPSWYLMPDAMSHFFKLCGTSIDDHLDLVPLEPAYRVIDDHGEFIDVTSDIDAMAELFESREPGAGAKLRTYIDSATQVYNLAIDGFLYTNFTNFIPYLSPGMLRLLPKLLASLSTSLKVKVNTQFRDTKLRQILSYPAVFLSSDPSHTPALYHLMSHTDLVQGVSYPRGGFTAFIKALISLIDDAVLHLGTPVSAITTQGRNATGVQVGSEFIEADIVISCADQHHTETQLLPASLCAKPETSWKNKQPGLSTVLVLAGVKGEHTLLFPPTGTKISAKFSTAPPQNSRLQNPSRSPRPPQQIPMPHPKATRTSSSWSQYPPMSPLVTGPLTEKNLTWWAGSQ
ncbi:hypothetical protein cgisf_2670 [Corynebacterium glutamicum]|nr:phytoene desaturase [Corynebacterium glutamicum]QYO74399.1 hypothetical protein cgisf_2670 [Corynebacterium glutamicum]CAF21094.1 PHYTOENE DEHYDROGENASE (DESATURASE) (N-terminal fragment) [Corynebacterium glutamicum ATCC 13032]